MQNMEQIYKDYFKIVYKYLFCLTHNKDTAEELTQETFCKAVEKINTYNGKCKISVWLCQIAKHLWYNQYKKEKMISNREELIDIAEFNSLENQVISNDEKLTLYKKMQQLDERTREVMYLRISGELTFKEIGIILNKSANWAKVTFYRGKIKLEEVEQDERNKEL